MFRPTPSSAKHTPRLRHLISGLTLGLGFSIITGCATNEHLLENNPGVAPPQIEENHSPIHVQYHDDLVSAGLGIDGLRSPAPTPASAELVTPQLLRQLAFHTQYNGLSAISTATGLGEFSASALPVVPGIEVSTWRKLDAMDHQARALLQIPDGFDPAKPCLIVAPASGSRGVYGAVPLVAPWGLPKGCAIVYSDKGAGTDYFDGASQTGVDLIGQRRHQDEAMLGFVPPRPPKDANEYGQALIAAHAHSQVNVEAYWGAYTLDAAQWAERYLTERYKLTEQTDLKVIAAGLSNGGQAVLRALEGDQSGLIDAVVSVMPNITPPQGPHLYDYAIVAALAQPCAFGDTEFASTLPFANPLLIGFAPIRCRSLHEAGLIDSPSPQAALDWLTAFGFDTDGLTFSASIVALDLWRIILANYASAYMKTSFADMPCGYGFDASSATDLEKHLWWATGSGSPPNAGITLTDAQMANSPQDPHFAGLNCLYALRDDPILQASLASTRANAKWPHPVPVYIIHGQVDALIPAIFSSRPYVAQAKRAGMMVSYEEIEGAQHFDAFLNVLPAEQGWVPILPTGWKALDQAWSDLASN